MAKVLSKAGVFLEMFLLSFCFSLISKSLYVLKSIESW